MNKFLDKHINKILYIFIIIQPILDVITAISIKKFNYDLTIGAIIRFSFLLFCIFYLVFINKEKRKINLVVLGIFSTYLIIYTCLVILNKDANILVYELKNCLNTFYFPITLLSIYEMFKQYKIKFDFKIILITYSIYLALIIIPDLTHTSFLSYSHSKLGTVGWFMSANAIGNIISILLPLVLYFVFKVYKNIYLSLVLLITSLWITVNIGTKAPLIACGLIIFFNLIYVYVHNYKLKNYKVLFGTSVAIIVGIILSIIIIPKTAFYRNLEIHRKYLKINNYSEVLTNYDNINNFIFSERLTFLNNSFTSYKKSTNLEKVFGIGYVENYKTNKESTKTVEIDYCDIFIRHGIFGFIIYISLFIVFLSKGLKEIFKNKNLLNLEFLVSISLVLLLGLFSGHIFITPAVSIYISLLLCVAIFGFKIDKA